MQKMSLFREPNISAKYDAFPYQNDAVNAVKDLEYCAIFHEQGLGKTKIAIDLMLYWLKQKQVDVVLYVTKNGLVQNWVNEFKTHTYMKPKVLSQNAAKNHFVFNSPSRLILTHFEVITSEKERIKLFCKTRNVAIIIDESAKIKNPDAAVTKAFFDVSLSFKKRVIMTGTPVANRPYDIWSQVYFLDQGKALGTSFSNFKKKTNLDNDLAESKEKANAFEDEIASIYAKIGEFTVRETKSSGVIKLPNKEIVRQLTCWEPRQYDIYREIKNELRTTIFKDGVLQIDDVSEILKRLLRLIQISSNPRLVDDSYKNRPGKIDVLDNIISTIMCNKEKCIIWTNFIDNVEWLAKYLVEYSPVMIYGSMSMLDRNNSVNIFQNDPETRILVATPASAKEGLTLTSANHAIFFDRTFSLEDYLQAQDRIHRISQKKDCYVYNLVMEDSIDEWIDLLIDSKNLAAQLSQGDISREYYEQHIQYDYGQLVHEILCSEDRHNE